MHQFTLKDFLIEAVEKGERSFKTENLIECRLTSLNPLAFSDDYLTGFYIYASEEIRLAIINPSFNKVSLNLKIAFHEFEFVFNQSSDGITLVLRIINPAIIILKDLDIIRCSVPVENIHENSEMRDLVSAKMGKGLFISNSFLQTTSSVAIPMVPTKKTFLAKPTTGLLSEKIKEVILIDDED